MLQGANVCWWSVPEGMSLFSITNLLCFETVRCFTKVIKSSTELGHQFWLFWSKAYNCNLKQLKYMKFWSNQCWCIGLKYINQYQPVRYPVHTWMSTNCACWLVYHGILNYCWHNMCNLKVLTLAWSFQLHQEYAIQTQVDCLWFNLPIIEGILEEMLCHMYDSFMFMIVQEWIEMLCIGSALFHFSTPSVYGFFCWCTYNIT